MTAADDFGALAGRRVLVTGATGRIGTATCALLTAAGARVTGLADRESDAVAVDRLVIGDTTSPAVVAGAVRDADLVVHLAALAHRDIAPAFDVFRTNVLSTFNVLQQAGEAGLPRAVLAGSINAYGLPQNVVPLLPAYFPLDTEIPYDLGDWYSLSKRNDEDTARMAWRHWGIDTVTLRFPHVNDQDGLLRQTASLTEDPATGIREAWSYLDVRDAARAIALSLVATTAGAHAFFLAADRTNAPYPTEAMLDRFAAGVPRTRRFPGRTVPIDLTPARTLIGFAAEHELQIDELDLPDDA